MTELDKISTHPEPFWRDRSDFIIVANIPEYDRIEQLWARHISARQFELCCIPFFVYDMALGDVVETDDELCITKVTKPSGRFVFRVWFGESSHPQQNVVAELEALGGSIERSSTNLIAVDAPDAQVAQFLADLLKRHETQRNLMFETGRQS
ncbi:MAG: DUF4265 domain-containing protein [Sphingopyxis sp.]|nr:DUF4265 domain-containing protein [Sphingopyxis sp.]